MIEAKRGPGRPRVRPTEEQIVEDNQMNTPVFVAETQEVKSAVRGHREAAIRAEQIRSRQKDEGEIREYNEFHIDPAIIPDGWDYNWKTYTVLGQKNDAYDVELAQAGWEPVDASRHPEMMPIGYKGYIVRKEMILMERPAEISEQAKQRELYEARKAVADKERALGIAPSGHMDRDHQRTGVRKSYEPMAIPKS
jgi:hypothetical protein